eukprot:TRINITY_DN11040_c0_g2_i1.p1 TRINITY_DN11040_c0_g2~~TRINITY_DN11040_c0_g2_i1.p1  ORF type:complete len:158 (+),score=25.12 TRINITY_DN11040_c0_g2_i1:3-476(+)
MMIQIARDPRVNIVGNDYDQLRYLMRNENFGKVLLYEEIVDVNILLEHYYPESYDDRKFDELLNHPKINLHTIKAALCALQIGRIDIVNSYLDDPSCDLGSRDKQHYLLEEACTQGKKQVVEKMLNHPKMDSGAVEDSLHPWRPFHQSNWHKIPKNK